MDIRNIMINDWIHYKNCTGKNEFFEEDIQVYNIYGSEVNCRYEDDTITYGKYLMDCSPIMLTKEIFEINGFDIKETEHYYRKNENDYILIFHEKTNDFAIADVHNKESLAIIRINVIVNYVHEIQHALRLYGLNEMADNWKIR